MGKRSEYVTALLALRADGWESYLAARSGLPGPRGNLELLHAVADVDANRRQVVHGDADGGQQLAGWLPGGCDGQGRIGRDRHLVDVVHGVLGNDHLEPVVRDPLRLRFDVHGEKRRVERCGRCRPVDNVRLRQCWHATDRHRGGQLHGRLTPPESPPPPPGGAPRAAAVRPARAMKALLAAPELSPMRPAKGRRAECLQR